MDPSSDETCMPPMRCMEIRGCNRAVEEAFRTPGLDAWVYSLPFEGSASGGDLHYVSLCGGGVITRLVVADVSGHGERVAEFSDALRTLMRKNINTKSQTRLVTALNRQFGETAQSLRFATAVVATYLATTRILTVCNAGHPRPLWRSAATGSWEPLDRPFDGAGNLPLGLDDDSPYNQFSVALGDGDVLLFYTDALTEAMDSSGRLLGEDGLIEIAKGLDATDPHRLAPALLDAIGRHRAGKPADDDVTLLTLYHTGRGRAHLSLSDKLDVYMKLLGLRSVETAQ